MKHVTLLKGLVLFAAAVLTSGMAWADAEIDCSTSSNLDCDCGSGDVCTETRECISGDFLGWNNASKDDRTGVMFCGVGGGLKIVTITFTDTSVSPPTTDSATIAVSGTNCASAHLDELIWSANEPEITAFSQETFDFTVLFGKVSPLRSLTADGTNYTVHKVNNCTE